MYVFLTYMYEDMAEKKNTCDKTSLNDADQACFLGGGSQTTSVLTHGRAHKSPKKAMEAGTQTAATATAAALST